MSSNIWIICVQGPSGRDCPNVTIIDANKLPEKMREAYLIFDGKSEERVLDAVLGEDYTDEQMDGFYKMLETAQISNTSDVLVNKILTYSAYA